jgi:DNA-binding LacI/PurR family transcriptional regulator
MSRKHKQVSTSGPDATVQKTSLGRWPKMADIARLAGVSIGSVSRALSGSKEVSESTRARVLKLAKKLNYAVNAGARNLRRGRTQTISVITPLLGEGTQHLTDPFLWALVGHIAERLTTRGYRMLLSRLAVEADNVAEDVESGAADGLIFTGQWIPHQRLNQLALAGVPFTVWGAEQARQVYSSVGTDNRTGGRLAVEHLFARGASSVLFVGDWNSLEVRDRLMGYHDAHRARGVRGLDELLVPFTFDSAKLRCEVAALVAGGLHFDGVFAASDVAAIAVMHELQARGIKPGRDVRVVGYDDIPAAAMVTPSLSTVRQSLDHAAAGLVDGVLNQLAGQQPANFLVPSEMVIRDSSALITRKHGPQHGL